MRWIAPASKDNATATLEKRLWAAADELRANSGLSAAQYSQPVLGLIFLRFADAKFAARRTELEKGVTRRRGSRVDEPAAYHASGVLFLPPEARFEVLLEYPEGGRRGKTLGQAIDDAMRAIERENPQLSGVLPKTYQVFNARLLKELLKTFSTIPVDLEGGLLRKIYEYCRSSVLSRSSVLGEGPLGVTSPRSRTGSAFRKSTVARLLARRSPPRAPWSRSPKGPTTGSAAGWR